MRQTTRQSGGEFRQILGVQFFNGPAEEAVEYGLNGGLVVVPAAPALAEMPYDGKYTEALLNADMAITDSGLMVLLWRLLRFEKLRRLSGLEYLVLLLEREQVRQPGAVLWIMPTEDAMRRNVEWLQGQGHPTTEEDCYLAPKYAPNDVTDAQLLELVRTKRPAHIIVGLGGGIQEKLGYYLRANLDYKPGIHCIGAAIGFLSGDQVRIPMWADRFYLGWLCRCLYQPSRYGPRYWRARQLVPLMIKYREQQPEPAA